MLRRILVTLVVALAGLLTFGGVASADLGRYGGASSPGLGVAPEDEVVAPGETFELFLGDFDSGEVVDVVGAFDPADGTPSGLRSARAFARLASPLNFTVTVDDRGAAVIPVSYTEQGTYTFVATGRTSGRSNSISVIVGAAGGSGGYGSNDSSNGSGDSGDWAGGTNAGSGSSSTSDSGLATTGASVAGPIAIGLSALLAGLALLFFGTRGVVRHKGSRSTASV